MARSEEGFAAWCAREVFEQKAQAAE